MNKKTLLGLGIIGTLSFVSGLYAKPQKVDLNTMGDLIEVKSVRSSVPGFYKVSYYLDTDGDKNTVEYVCTAPSSQNINFTDTQIKKLGDWRKEMAGLYYVKGKKSVRDVYLEQCAFERLCERE